MMIYNYCTLFDSYYLNRALAMYDSLTEHNSRFHLYIFAFDDRSEKILREFQLANVTIVSLNEFENPRLLAVKAQRSKGEYCWTCTPSVIDYCITQFNLDHCTYIDADLFFFSDPNILVDELGTNDILITEHRYTRKYDQSKVSGIYCVQFITFRNTNEGMTALRWWRDRCIEWCFDRFEDGKFGDQKYLDDWTSRFEKVHVLQNPGGGVAPWNVQQYSINGRGRRFSIREITTGRQHELIFYHFHAVRFLRNAVIDLGSYQLPVSSRNLYAAYLKKIAEVNERLLDVGFDPVVQPYQTKKAIPLFIHKILRRILGVYNVYPFNFFLTYGQNS